MNEMHVPSAVESSDYAARDAVPSDTPRWERVFLIHCRHGTDYLGPIRLVGAGTLAVFTALTIPIAIASGSCHLRNRSIESHATIANVSLIGGLIAIAMWRHERAPSHAVYDLSCNSMIGHGSIARTVSARRLMVCPIASSPSTLSRPSRHVR